MESIEKPAVNGTGNLGDIAAVLDDLYGFLSVVTGDFLHLIWLSFTFIFPLVPP